MQPRYFYCPLFPYLLGAQLYSLSVFRLPCFCLYLLTFLARFTLCFMCYGVYGMVYTNVCCVRLFSCSCGFNKFPGLNASFILFYLRESTFEMTNNSQRILFRRSCMPYIPTNACILIRVLCMAILFLYRTWMEFYLNFVMTKSLEMWANIYLFKKLPNTLLMSSWWNILLLVLSSSLYFHRGFPVSSVLLFFVSDLRVNFEN